MAGLSIGDVLDIYKSLICPHCKLLLKNPVQTEDGERLCRACFEEIRNLPGHECKDCGVCIPTETNHVEGCGQRIARSKACEYLQTLWPIFPTELENMRQEDGLSAGEYNSAVSSREKFARPEPRSSLASDVVTPGFIGGRNSHSSPASMEVLSRRTRLVASCGPVDPGLSSPGTVKPHDFTSSSHSMQPSKNGGRNMCSPRLKHYDEKIKIIQAGVEKVSAQLQTSKKQQQKQLQKMEDTVEDIKASICDLRADNHSDKLQEQVAVLTEQVAELEFLVALLLSTHNDGFIWRIPDVSKRRTDAIDRHVTSVYSPPFYSGSNGYKMCLRAYFNGDGIGYQTHLSLFFVLMRGECDSSLVWPFAHKVSMILVDQTHRKHIVQTFKPIPESSSFQRPKTEMNVASGCPQFAKLSVLDDPSYVKDDVMFIKCIVDTTRLFH